MSSTPIRHGSTAHAAATRQAEHDPKHTQNHRHHAHTGHGQFGNYVFRYGRPAPPAPRRPVPLRARQKPPSAQSGAAEHEPEHFDPSANVSARAGALDDEGTRPANMDAMPDDDASHDQTGQRRSRSRPQVRVMPEPTPSAKTLETLLEQLCGEPAQVLCRKTGTNVGTNVGTIARAEHAQALLGVLLAIAPDMATGNTKLSAQALQLTAVRAYLRSGERGPFTTLERVKQVLMENSASKRTQGTRTAAPAPISEKQQDRHLLLPLMLLNADRLRLDDQRDQACDRMELLSASRHMQVPRS
jgi:hypothetical protein